jgi:hypothetical protein
MQSQPAPSSTTIEREYASMRDDFPPRDWMRPENVREFKELREFLKEEFNRQPQRGIVSAGPAAGACGRVGEIAEYNARLLSVVGFLIALNFSKATFHGQIRN